MDDLTLNELRELEQQPYVRGLKARIERLEAALRRQNERCQCAERRARLWAEAFERVNGPTSASLLFQDADSSLRTRCTRCGGPLTEDTDG